MRQSVESRRNARARVYLLSCHRDARRRAALARSADAADSHSTESDADGEAVIDHWINADIRGPLYAGRDRFGREKDLT
jgi:hypothetical protein